MALFLSLSDNDVSTVVHELGKLYSALQATMNESGKQPQPDPGSQLIACALMLAPLLKADRSSVPPSG